MIRSPLFSFRSLRRAAPFLVVGALVSTSVAAQNPSLQSGPTPMISGGAEATRLAQRIENLDQLTGSPTGGVFGSAAYVPGIGFDAYNFDDNAAETGGFVFIPPDPMGAAGPDRLVSVVNVGIESRDKTGTLLWRDSLRDFFSAAPNVLGTFCFDPKIVYDEHAGRFVVVAMERQFLNDGDPADRSRIHVAVSRTSAPASATAADWYYYSIDSKLGPAGAELWADYPGLEVDEEVIYITSNFFPFPATSTGSFDQRLYIIHKAGFYTGGAVTMTLHDPYTSTGVAGFKTTTMPAQVHGAGGVAPGVGTYLLSYSGLTFGGLANPEALMLIRVDNPTGAVAFVQEFVTIGDIEDLGGPLGFPALADAPQMGSSQLIEVNDRRTLDAVWRNGYLYMTTTITPNASDPANQGHTTAHVVKLDATAITSSASGAGLVTLSAETNVGAEDIATTNYTFFPAVAVNTLDDVKVGFSGSASTTYGSAYVAEIDQTTFTPMATATVRAGVDWYYRAFNGPRNRWGDYSGIAVDPADGTTFWVYNEWADTRGTVIGTEDGRWGTAWLSCVQQPTEDFGDAPDPTYPTLLANNGARHTIVPGVFMGLLIDAEPDGQPDATATRDDLVNLDDEDGVAFPVPFVPGQPCQVDVTVSISGFLDAWVDFNLNGIWEPAELIYSGGVSTGLNPIAFNVPAGVASGQSFARFRYNTLNAGFAPTGPAPNGEVEDYAVDIEEPQEQADFGDAPDPSYPTLLANNGAFHVIDPTVFLGVLIDSEFDGQPDPNAKGDDIANLQDEDGVAWVTPLIPGGTAQIDVTASVDGWLDVWVDFDTDGAWVAAEQVYSGPVVAGLNNIPFVVPATTLGGGPTFARARFNLTGPLPVDGGAPDGEVEDYEVFVEAAQDFGDAPDPTYRTLIASAGAQHTIVPGVFLGNRIDAEPDGIPSPAAQGDDSTNLPDEDGVVWTTALVPGSGASFDVTASVGGWLDAWIDFDGNGVWAAAEQVYSGAVAPGLNTLPFAVPPAAVSGFTFARVRFNVNGPLPVSGPAPDGEVEDYAVEIQAPDTDFGDAPDGPYPTLFANNGARHFIQAGVFLGTRIDAEPDGQPDPTATGDDVANLPDEDGVAWVTPIVAGQNARMDVTASLAGQLDAWIDFDQNGSWLDPGEHVYSGPVAAGLNPIIFPVPPGATAGSTFARIRYNVNGNVMQPTGLETDGEVEDYGVNVELPLRDFGDAPDPTYPTLIATGGANHLVVAGIFLGNQIDAEADGQPHPNALGDDIANLADEDGVVWTSWKPGAVTPVTITASAAGWVDMWVDLDASGVWDPAELVISAAVNPGPNLFNVPVPGTAAVGFTFARVRYNTAGPLPPAGPAPDGEVEDYEVRIDPPDLDFGDAPDSYSTLLASNGPRHVINPGVYLGNLIDLEADGQPTAAADGDDVTTSDDEDGVVFSQPLVQGQPATVDVVASVAGWVDVWIDYDLNGVFDHPTELVVSTAVAAGSSPLNFNVPAAAGPGLTYARVRFNLTGALTPTGFAPDGEVEDYRARIRTQTGLPGDTGQLGFGAPYPNPFSSRVSVRFGLAAEEAVTVKVYAMDGSLVRTVARESFAPGEHVVHWDGLDDQGRSLPSGVYFIRMEAGSTLQNRKVLLVR